MPTPTPSLSDKVFKIHVQYINAIGMTVDFSSDYMTLMDCLNVREDWPSSIITCTDSKGNVKRVKGMG